LEVYDVTIIGAGPTGLFGAFYAGLRGLKVKIIEALPEIGGQVSVLYPEKYIYDIPGFQKIIGKDLSKKLYEQAMVFKPKICLNEVAQNLNVLNDELLEIETNQGKHHSKTIIISAGIGAFAPNKINKPGVQEFENKGVYYSVSNRSILKEKSVLIVGGGDSAVDWALNLNGYCKSVTLIHRRKGFRALESSLDELKLSNVDVKTFYELKEIKGSNSVESATIYDNKTSEETQLDIDALLIFFGHKADLGPIKNWNLDIDKRNIIVDVNMQTNIPRVFAAGDLVSQEGGLKLNLIAVGFSQAAIAVAAAKKIIDPTSPTFEHSSEKGLNI
tara:strand:+ start:211 stop:1200 length:990 start_codon:yes stop_codon:yes gene_type:complete